MTLMAVPAKPTPIKFTQPDGTTIMLQLKGDERSHIMMTLDGYPVVRDEKGFYCFAELTDENRLKSTDVIAQPVTSLNDVEKTRISRISSADVRKALAARNSGRFNAPAVVSRSTGYNGIGLMDDAFLGYKELKGLVILAQFKDVKFSSKCDKAFFTRMLNNEGFSEYGGTGSARDYFIDSSSGAFVPEFDVYGPVTLDNAMAYYGGNDEDGNDLRPGEMIRDACQKLDGQINFKDYDIDGDGYVDNVFVFYAGYGEASYRDDNTVWPHQWTLSAQRLSLTVDGVKVDKYACSNEMELDENGNSIPDGVGTFVHEFSHVLGIPDLYCTDSNGEWTPGPWSVMDQGPYNNDGRTPPAYSAYERNALGWCEPTVIDGAESVTLEAIVKSNKACLIPTSKQNEFFLIENRQQTGWDKYLPGHGMIVWHIDYNQNVWVQNTVNNLKSHNYVDLEEACGYYVDSYDYLDEDGYIKYDEYMEAFAAYSFPGTTGKTSFTDSTSPSMKTWAGKGLGLPITNICERNGVITFDVAGGRCDAAVPEVAAPVETGDDWFTASWKAANGASSYLLTVEAFIGAGLEKTETADFGSGGSLSFPQGWALTTGTAGGVYTSNGNYGDSAPSLKLSAKNHGFMTREFEGDVKTVKFWLKGQSTNDGKSYLNIEGLVGANWVNIETVYPLNNKISDVEICDIPSGVRQIKVTYYKSKGNVAIDDFAVTYGGSGYKALDGYDGLDVGNVTSYRITGVPSGVTDLYYKVCAVDAGGRRSAYSESQEVKLGAAGIESVTVEAEISISVNGLDLNYYGASSDNVTVYDINGRKVVSAVADYDGTAVLHLPANGLYVVTAPGYCKKVQVK